MARTKRDVCLLLANLFPICLANSKGTMLANHYICGVCPSSARHIHHAEVKKNAC